MQGSHGKHTEVNLIYFVFCFALFIHVIDDYYLIHIYIAEEKPVQIIVTFQN